MDRDHTKNCPDRNAHYNASDINGKLIINFRDINHTMRSLYEGRGSQSRILIILLESGRITQCDLTERLGIQAGSASEVIAKLENFGLLIRTVNKADRRTVDITLTEEGVRRAEEAKLKREQRHEQMFSCLSYDEKTQLLSLLEKLALDWNERYHDLNEKEVSSQRHNKCEKHKTDDCGKRE